jgi:low temperature requirement protein LtrA
MSRTAKSQPGDLAARARSRWLRPPVLRTAERERGERHATWTELFFDLVFMVAVSRAATILTDDQSPSGFGWFTAVLLLIVWSWVNYVFYSERFDTDDAVHRLMKAAVMLAVAAVAVTAPAARGADAGGFAASYLCIRLGLLAFYIRAWRHVPEARPGIRPYLIGFAFGAACWAASIPAPPEVRPLLWLAGTSVELITPIFGWRALGQSAVAAEHLQERSGQFTIIVLGQAVAGIVYGLAATQWGISVWLTTIAAAALVVCLWWLTFDFAEVGVPEGLRGLLYVYGHIPMYWAITSLGVGVQLAIEHAAELGLDRTVRGAICGSLAVYLGGVTLFQLAAGMPLDRARGARLVTAAAALVLAATSGRLAPPALLGTVAAIVAVQLIVEALTRAEGSSG